MSFPLQKLLQVRENREKQIARKVDAARQHLNQAIGAVETGQQQLLTYQQNSIKRAAQLESNHVGQNLSCKQLENWQTDLLWMKEQQQQMTQALQDLRQTQQERETELAEIRRKQAQAQRATQKIETRREIWLQEESSRLQRAEELELEDRTWPKRAI